MPRRPFHWSAVDRSRTILLVGPTGSGKTPLGERLDQGGLAGQRCHHFDFGAQLRAAVEEGRVADLAATEVELIRSVLATGALLEDNQFSVAEKLIRGFLGRRRPAGSDWVVLNGLPRHVGQARALERVLDVRCVVELQCTADTVRERLASDAGGDRADRVDDDPGLVAHKLALYAERTQPLIEHYRQGGVPVIGVVVGVETSAREMVRQVETAPITRSGTGS